MAAYKKVMAYSGNTFTRNWIADEKQNPLTGTPYAWVRARVLGGKTNLWGRVSLRFSDRTSRRKSFDGFGEDWPIGYADISPYYERSIALLGISGTKENLPQLPDGIYQRGVKLNCGEVMLKHAIAKMGRHLIPGRAGVTTDGVANKYRARCMGRGRCGRGCDLQAPFHSPTALIFPARDTGNLTVRPNSIVSEVLVDDEQRARRPASASSTAKTKEMLRLHGQGRDPGGVVRSSRRACCCYSKSEQYPNGLANSSGVVGHYFCEHIMGPRASGYMPALQGHDADQRRRPAVRHLHRALPQRHRRAPGLHPRLRLPGRQRQRRVSRITRTRRRASAPAFKKTVRDLHPTPISISALRRGAGARENHV